MSALQELDTTVTTTVNDPPAAAPEPEGHATPRVGTEYVVLELVDVAEDADAWKEVVRLVASSSDAAIRSHANVTKKAGTFVAVPARSFVMRTVETETTTLVNLM